MTRLEEAIKVERTFSYWHTITIKWNTAPKPARVAP